MQPNPGTCPGQRCQETDREMDPPNSRKVSRGTEGLERPERNHSALREDSGSVPASRRPPLEADGEAPNSRLAKRMPSTKKGRKAKPADPGRTINFPNGVDFGVPSTPVPYSDEPGELPELWYGGVALRSRSEEADAEAETARSDCDSLAA